MLKKTFAAALTAAVLMSSGAAMAQQNTDPNWAFSKEVIQVLKDKNEAQRFLQYHFTKH